MRKKCFKLVFSPLGIIALLIGISFTSSCKKNANNQFLGTYPGKLVLVVKGDTTLDTLIITPGSSANSLIVNERAQGAIGMAIVNSNTITIPSQTVSVKGGVYPLSGSGSLNGKSLSLTFSEEISGVFVNSVFTGTKQ
jgi:hypothetical protein